MNGALPIVFPLLNAVATIYFTMRFLLRLLFEGSHYSRSALVKLTMKGEIFIKTLVGMIVMLPHGVAAKHQACL